MYYCSPICFVLVSTLQRAVSNTIRTVWQFGRPGPGQMVGRDISVSFLMPSLCASGGTSRGAPRHYHQQTALLMVGSLFRLQARGHIIALALEISLEHTVTRGVVPRGARAPFSFLFRVVDACTYSNYLRFHIRSPLLRDPFFSPLFSGQLIWSQTSMKA